MSREEQQQGTDRYLSAQQIADRYGLTRQWVYQCVKLRKYARNVGKYVMWRESDLEKFESERSKTQGFDLEHFMRYTAMTKAQERKARSKAFRLKFDMK